MKLILPKNEKPKSSKFFKIIKWIVIIVLAQFIPALFLVYPRIGSVVFLIGVFYLIYKFIYRPYRRKYSNGASLISKIPIPNFEIINNMRETIDHIKPKGNQLQFVINNTTTIENPFAGIFISGGAGSGKSKSLVEPIINQAGKKRYTGVVYDFKFPELAEYVNTAYKYSDIKPYYINFKDLGRSNKINPIAPNLMINDSYAREFAFTILANLNPTIISKPDFWSDNAIAYLSAIFWFLRTYEPQYCTLPHAITMALNPSLPTILNALSSVPKCGDMIASILTAYERGADDQLAGIVSSLQVALSKINIDEIYYLMSESDFDLELNNSESKGILVLGNDPALASTYAPIIGLILASAAKQLNRQGKEKSVFLIDEFPTVYIPNVEQLPATARSNKVATILACQDIAQLQDRYGKEKSETILSNLGNQFYGRTTNPTTAKRVSDIFGKVDKTTYSFNQENNVIFHSNKSRTESLRETDLVKMQEVAQLNTGSFYSILSEGKQRQGLSTIPMDKTFIKTPINAFKAVSDWDLQQAQNKVRIEIKTMLHPFLRDK